MRHAQAPRALSYGWAVGGALAGVLLALVVFAPARWLAHALHAASAGHLLLADARGTVWNGSARAVLGGGTGSRDGVALPGRLHWHLGITSPGALQLALRAECCTPQPLQLNLQPHVSRIHLSVADGRSVWPAAWLQGLGTPWNTLQPEGWLRLHTQGMNMRWTDGRLSLDGRAELVADAVSSRLSTLKPLGSYRLMLAGGSTPRLTLDTLSGSLQITGEGQWIGGRLRFEGTAQAEPERESALSNLLNLIGQRRGAQSRITLG